MTSCIEMSRGEDISEGVVIHADNKLVPILPVQSQVLMKLLSDKIPHVWLNGEFCTQLFTQVESEVTESPQDSVEDDVSDPEPVSTDSDEEET